MSDHVCIYIHVDILQLWTEAGAIALPHLSTRGHLYTARCNPFAMPFARFFSQSARAFPVFSSHLNSTVPIGLHAKATLRSSSMLLPAAMARHFSNDLGASKPMSFIEKAKLLGANAILGAMTHQGGFDSALQGMNIDRIDNGTCAASLLVTPNLANA